MGNIKILKGAFDTKLELMHGTKREFDELILEKRGTTYWIHFAVRPSGNRRKILFDCQ